MHKFYEVLVRQVPKYINQEQPNYQTVEYTNIPAIVAIPVEAGYCSILEIEECTVDQMLNMVEMVNVKTDNEISYHKYMESQREKK